MSLIYNIYYTGKNGAARAFVEEMENSGLVDLVRAQHGNEKYDYFFPKDDDETVLLIDSWVDQAAIDAHHKADHMQKISDLRKKYKLRLRFESYVTPTEEKNEG